MTTLNLGPSISRIEEGTFDSCTGLTSIRIPETVNYIGEGAFSDCSSLTSAIFPSTVTHIGRGVFGRYYNGANKLESLTVPFIGETKTTYTNIGYLFGYHEVSFGGGGYWYEHDIPDSLTHIELDNGCTSIPENAFRKFYEAQGTGEILWVNYTNTKLESLTIPKTVTSIGANAFTGAWDLENITYKGTKANWESISKGEYWSGQKDYSDESTITIHCTDGDIVVNR